MMLWSESLCRFYISRWIWRKHSILQKEREKISTRGHSSFLTLFASSRAMTEDYANCPDSFSSARHSSLAETNCGAHLSVTRSKIVVSPFGLSAGSPRQGPVYTRRETSYARETLSEYEINSTHTHIYIRDLSTMNLFSQFPWSLC